MIWALLAAYFLSGGMGVSGAMLTADSTKELSQRVDRVIADSDRAEEAQKTLAALRKDAKAFQKVFAKSGKQLSKSYRDHADDGEQALVILDELNADWEVAQQQAIDARFELRESMTAEEWAELFAAQ